MTDRRPSDGRSSRGLDGRSTGISSGLGVPGWLEASLRRGLPLESDGGAPPLLMLERFMFRLVGLGFILLTVTLVSGLLFSEEIFGRPLTFTHKNVFSVAGWLTFAILLFARWRYGWRGRRALRWILAGTLLLVLGYLGSKFVMEVLLRR